MEEQANLTQSFSFESKGRHEGEVEPPSPTRLNKGTSKTYQIDQNALTQYKSSLQKRVLWSLLLLFVVISERIFAAYTQRAEHDLIVSLQTFLGLSYENPLKYLQYVMFLENNMYFILLMTHYFIVVYYLYNAVTCLKIICVTFNGAVVIALLEMIFEDARPYWQDGRIVGAECVSSYGFPSFTLYGLIFIFMYSWHCFQEDSDDEESSWKIFDCLKAGLFIIVVGLFCFARIAAGIEYISQSLLTVLYTILIYSIAVFFDKSITDLVQKSSIDIQSAKRNCIFWMMYLLLLSALATITYVNCDTFPNINWFSHYFDCRELSGQADVLKTTPYYHLLGAWGAFLKTGVLFIIMGAVFGTALSFRDFKGVVWYQTNRKNRVIMTAIASLCVIPSWFIMYLEQEVIAPSEKGQFNMYISNAIHFTVLYFLILGILPKQVFERLGLVDKNSEYQSMVEGEMVMIESNGL